MGLFTKHTFYGPSKFEQDQINTREALEALAALSSFGLMLEIIKRAITDHKRAIIHEESDAIHTLSNELARHADELGRL